MTRQIDLLIHEAALREDSLRHRLVTALESLPPTTGEPMLARLARTPRRVPTLVLTGLHSGGKSMLIRALTDGAAEVVVDVDVATDQVTEYTWDGAVTLIDTPGVHAGVAAHDERALSALKAADLVLFVITPDLFDDLSAQHLRFVADELGKRRQLLVVVNKAQTRFAAPGVRQKALASVLGEGALPPLVECDAKDYVRSLTAEDAARAARLRDGSGIDALREQINAFSVARGDLARLSQPFQVIRSTAADAAATLVETPEERELVALLTRIRQSLADNAEALQVELDATRQTFLTAALVPAQKYAREIEALGSARRRARRKGELAASERVTSELNELEGPTRERLEGVVQRAQERLAADFHALDAGPEAAFLRSSAVVPSRPVSVDPSRDAAVVGAAAGQPPSLNARVDRTLRILKEFDSYWGAGSGVKAAAGTPGHQMVLRVGTAFGKKWQPWQAVRLADKIGKTARVAGAALQVGAAVAEAIAEERRARAEEQERVERQRLIVDGVRGQAEANIDGVLAEVRALAGGSFGEGYRQVDEQLAELAQARATRSTLRDELRAIEDECARMTGLLGREIGHAAAAVTSG